MLRKLSSEMADCLVHAETCARKAAKATTDKDRAYYFGLQQHWLTLACSYEFGERLNDFSKENTWRRADFDRQSASQAVARAEATTTNDLRSWPTETQFVEPWHHAACAVCDVITAVSELADILQVHPELRYDLIDLEAAHRALGRIVAVVKQRAAR